MAKYWVGGTGNSNDTAHWATSSGGAGSTGVPTAADDVIFDTASDANAYTFTVNAAFVCRNITFGPPASGAVTWAGSSTMAVSGSIVIGSTTVSSYTGTLTMNASGTKTITSNSVSNAFGLTIDSPGKVQLVGALTTTGAIVHTRGNFDLNGNALTALTFTATSTTNHCRLRSNSGVITLTGNAATILNITTTIYWLVDQATVTANYSGAVGTRVLTVPAFAFLYYFNINITAGTDTLTLGTGTFGSLNYTGFAGTLNNTTRTITGNLTIAAGMTLTAGSSVTTLAPISGTKTITSNGKTLDFPVTITGLCNTVGVGSTIKPADALTLGATRTLTVTTGVFDMDGKTVSVGLFVCNSGSNRALKAGGTTMSITGNAATVLNINSASTGFTLLDAITINATYAGSTGTRVFTCSQAEVTAVNLNINAGTDSVTISAGTAPKDLNFTGFSGTLTSSHFTVFGSLTYGAGMTCAAGGSTTTIGSSSGTKTITTNGVTIKGGGFSFAAASGATIQFADNITYDCTGSPVFTRNSATFPGTMDPNGKTFTLTATGQITFTGALTFFDLTRAGTASLVDSMSLTAAASVTVTGTLTLTGNSASNRIPVTSSTVGTSASLVAAAVSLTDVDFQDVVASGAASPFTGTRLGDYGGNSGITMTTPANKYYVGNTASWNTASVWATSSGAAGATNNYPLPQDTAILDNNSFNADGQTITMAGSLRYPSIDFSAMTNRSLITMSLASSTPFYGSLTLSTANGFTISGASTITFSGRGSYTLDTKNVVPLSGLTVNSVTGTLTLAADAQLISTNDLTLTSGTFSVGTYDFYTGTVSVNGVGATVAGTLTLTSGQMHLTGNNGTILNGTLSLTSLYTLNRGSKPILARYTGSTGTRTIAGITTNNHPYPFNDTVSPNISVIAGTDAITHSGFLNTTDFRGYSGAYAASNSYFNNTVTFSSGMTIASGVITFAQDSGTQNIDTRGMYLNSTLTTGYVQTTSYYSKATYVYTSPVTAINTSGNISHSSGTVDFNGQTIKAYVFIPSTGNSVIGVLIRFLRRNGATLNVVGNNATPIQTISATVGTTKTLDTFVLNSVYQGGTGTRTFSIGGSDERFELDINVTGGSDTLTLNGGRVRHLNTTGFVGVFASGAFLNSFMNGNITIPTGTITAVNGTMTLGSTSSTTRTITITPTAAYNYDFNGVNGSWQLGADLNIVSGTTIGRITVTAGTLNGNGKNVTALSATIGSATLNMGSGTWTVTGSGGVLQVSSGLATLNGGTSTLKITDASTTQKVIQYASATYSLYNVWLNAAAGSGSLSITYNPTIPYTGAPVLPLNDLKIDPGHQVFVKANLSLATLTASGTSGAGNLVTIEGFQAGPQSTITKTGGGTVSLDYVIVKDLIGLPVSTFSAGANSYDGGNNTNWTFSNPHTPGQTWYVDFENGSDSNTGASFAQRLKTINAATADKGVGAGDTIRVIGSPAPTSLGINATFTDCPGAGGWLDQPIPLTGNFGNSTNATPINITLTSHGFTTGDTVGVSGHTGNTNANGIWDITVVDANNFTLNGSVGIATGRGGTVRRANNLRITLASALTKEIALNGNQNSLSTSINSRVPWNVASTLNTTGINATNKEGWLNGTLTVTISDSFTTGLVAYFATGTLDLSAYQQISFWLRAVTGSLNAGDLSIRLCTDTKGLVPVHTASIPVVFGSGQYMPVLVDTGGAMNSAITSVAVYADVARTGRSIILDNIIACKAPGNDSLSLQSLIGKNDGLEGWWPVQSIVGTRVIVDNLPNTASPPAATLGYAGVTETVTAYKREPSKAIASTAAVLQQPQNSGNVGSLISYEGGWDRTAMTTQNLESWLDFAGYNLAGLTVQKSNLSWNKINFSHLPAQAVLISINTGYNVTFNNIAAVGYNAGIQHNSTSTLSGLQQRIVSAVFNGGNLAITTNPGFRPSVGTITAYSGSNINAGGLVIDTLVMRNLSTSSSLANTTQPSSIKSLSAKYSGNTNQCLSLGSKTYIRNLVVENGTGNSLGLTGGTGAIKIMGGDTSNNGVPVVSSARSLLRLASGPINIAFKNFTIGDPVVFYPTPAFLNIGGKVSSVKEAGTYGTNKIYSGLGLISSTNSVLHGASGYSWQFSPTSLNCSSAQPLEMSLARVVCASGTLVTFKAWLRRDNTGLTLQLNCKGAQIAGVSSDVVSSMTAAVNTWEQITITFTPSEPGVVEIFAQAYGGTTYNGYVHDVSVTQA